MMQSDILDYLFPIANQTRINKQSTEPKSVQLNERMATVLGVKNRRLIPFSKVVVEAISNKLFLKELSTTALDISIWLKRNKFETLQRKLYSSAVRDGKSFLMVTWNNETRIPKLHVKELYDGTSGVYLFHNELTGAPEYAVNIWTIDKTVYLDIYYPNRVEKYQKREDDKEWDKRLEDSEWPISWTDTQGMPLGIPFIQFGEGESEVSPALQIQRDLNEALLDLTAVSRSQGWPQRVLKGEPNPGTLVNAHGNVLTNSLGLPITRGVKLEPGSILILNSDSADFKQLETAEPNTDIVRLYLEVLSLLTTVPTHYFSGNWPSGVALLQAEERLNGKVEDWQGELTSSFEDSVRQMLRLSNTFGGTAYNIDAEIITEWYPPQIETADLKMEIERERVNRVTLGYEAGIMSLETAIRTLHPEWDETQIANEVARIQAEKTVINI